MAPKPNNTNQQPQTFNPDPSQNAPLNEGRVVINKKVVDAVMAETKEGFDDKLNPVPGIELTFENVSIWAKMKLRKGFCKSGKLPF
jgi:hypothetical protein